MYSEFIVTPSNITPLVPIRCINMNFAYIYIKNDIEIIILNAIGTIGI